MDQDIVNHFVIMGPQGHDTMWPNFWGISGTGAIHLITLTHGQVWEQGLKVGAEKWCV